MSYQAACGRGCHANMRFYGRLRKLDENSLVKGNVNLIAKSSFYPAKITVTMEKDSYQQEIDESVLKSWYSERRVDS